jgi:hypothetical protein
MAWWLLRHWQKQQRLVAEPRTILATTTGNQLWNGIVTDFRQACLLRREGRVRESDKILNEDLPPQIAEWSQAARQDPATKRAALENLFREEQKRIDDAWVVHRMLFRKFETEIVPSLCAKVAAEVKEVVREHLASFQLVAERVERSERVRALTATPKPPRVRFDDITQMIDQVQAEQQRDYGRKPRTAMNLA